MKNFTMPKIDFMGQRYLAYTLSGIMLLVSIGALLFQQLNFGLDFTGGTLVEVRYAVAPSLDAVRQALEAAGYRDVSVQTFGASHEVLIRLQQAFDADVGEQVVSLLRTGGDSVDLVRAEFVGAQVGEQLRDQSGIGLLVALGMVMIYVAFRFQYKFAIGAAFSQFHDMLIVVGVFALFQLEFDLTVLAALLAVVGYSLNDTIVIYDRIRENIRKSRTENMKAVFNDSINQTLSRTMMTSISTLIVLIALFFLGGDMLRNFSIALIVGVIVGTFSSIYVASALLLTFKLERRDLIPVKKESTEEEEELP